jgi:hypothetical protein
MISATRPFRPSWSTVDLPAFETTPNNSDAERRQSSRLKADLLALVDPLTKGRPSTRVTRVTDLSGEGVGLLSANSYPEGSVLWLELVDRAGQSYTRMRARLVHVTRQADGDWRLGCKILKPLDKPA